MANDDEEETLQDIAVQVSRVTQTASLIQQEVNEQTSLLDNVGQRVNSAGESTVKHWNEIAKAGKDRTLEDIYFLSIIMISLLLLILLYWKLA
eukprot:jgi/Galph1/3364/GphlegSOOS_G2048.1